MKHLAAGMRHLATWAFLIWVLAPFGTSMAAGRDVLLEIVANCVDASAPDYCGRCRWPRADSACGRPDECRKTTEVWNLSEGFAAIRDVKMCGCPAGFVHGLALPRNRVTGVEDPRRPAGIWQFAWETAQARIEASAVALVVNPAGRRSQDQLHVHLLRLRPGMEAEIHDNLAGTVRDLGEVWNTAAQNAAARGLADYGVLVTRQAGVEFQVVVTAGSPETAFTEWECR
jgi:CDP-diacylglycerol pyrophosphatase